MDKTAKQLKRQRRQLLLKVMRYLVILICLGGFSNQTWEFLQLYWTYPTLVDIQIETPTYIDLPAITICNPIGFSAQKLCLQGTKGNKGFCLPKSLARYASGYMCSIYPATCIDGRVPDDFEGVMYNIFYQSIDVFTMDMIADYRTQLKDYANCTIQYGGKSHPCNMEDIVMGPFYSTEQLPQVCYTMYSLWGQPNKTRQKIPQQSKMELQFFLNASNRPGPLMGIWTPVHNLPSSPAIQMSIHSPYFLPSPFVDGLEFLGGKSYSVRVDMKETHLLPYPYQTNCTDYMKPWEKSGGMAPINQMGVVQKCRMEFYYGLLGCVPLLIDYPHKYPLCGGSCENCTKFTSYDDTMCSQLSDSYSQPCDSITYTTTKEEVAFSVYETTNVAELTSRMIQLQQESMNSSNSDMDDSELLDIDQAINIINNSKTVRTKMKGYDCAVNKVWSDKCSTINVTILFDRFESTKFTYKPKFESLELFSVIGGYMGMWLGISFVAIYDLIGTGIRFLYAKRSKRRRAHIRIKRRQDLVRQNLYNNRPPRIKSFYLSNF